MWYNEPLKRGGMETPPRPHTRFLVGPPELGLCSDVVLGAQTEKGEKNKEYYDGGGGYNRRLLKVVFHQ